MRSGMLSALAAIAILLPGAPAAHAKEIFTGPLRRPVGSTLGCDIANVGKKPLRGVEIEFRTNDGSTVSLDPIGDLAPGAMQFVSSASFASVYCVFRFDGSPKAVRALACLSDDAGYCQAISEAR